MKTKYTLLVAGLAVQQATATWNFLDIFNTPTYNSNQCTEQQKLGFNWSGLRLGATNFLYGGFDFSAGWTCASSFGKRDKLTERTFGGLMIMNSCSKQKPASFSYSGQTKAGFSITDMDISVQFDIDLELQYTMTDGSMCKQYASCSTGGTTVKNTQCGGAKSVDVYISPYWQGSRSSCEIGFHHIGFDCNPRKGYTPPSPPQIPYTTPAPPSPPKVPYTSPAPPYSPEIPQSSPAPNSSPEVPYTSPAPPSPPEVPSSSVAPSSPYEVPSSPATPPSPPEVPYTSSAVESKPVPTPPTSEETVVSQPPASSTPTTPETPATPTPETPSAPATNCGYGSDCNTPTNSPPAEGPYTMTTPSPDSSAPAYSAPPTVESSPVAPPPSYETPVIPPGSSPPAQESSTGVVPPPTPESPAAPPPCGYGQSCGGTPSVPAPPLSTGSPYISTDLPKPSGPSYSPANPPDVLPKCMNTWLQISTKCKDNTDKSCYCVNPEFTKNVIDCVSSYCSTADEIRTSLQYFIGICADHVPENPKIIGDCPTFILLNPTPTATPSGGEPQAPSSAISTDAPASPAPTPGSPAPAPAPESPAPTPENPAPAPAPEVPYTTITYGTTSLAVPQVHFTTQPSAPGATPAAPVELMPGNGPAEYPAGTTTGVPGGAPYPVPSTMGTKTGPAASGSGVPRPSSPAEFTGAASPFVVVPKQAAIIGAALAFFAL